MILVVGWLRVRPEERDAYLSGCVEVVRQARTAPGCLDYSLGPDLLEPDRITVLERWADRDALEAFRGAGPSEEQQGAILQAEVHELDLASPAR